MVGGMSPSIGARACYLYATDGRKFLDFTSGIAVTGLGHCHPHVVEAVTEQAKRCGTSRTCSGSRARRSWRSGSSTIPSPTPCSSAIRVPRRSNSAIKVARKYQSETGHPERFRIDRLRRVVSRPHLRDPRGGRQRGLSEGLRAGRSTASTMSPSATSTRCARRSARRRRRSWSSRCRARAACARRRRAII